MQDRWSADAVWVRSAFVMAPVVGLAMTAKSLAEIRVPVHIVVGKDDDRAVPALDAEPMAAHIHGPTLEVLPRKTDTPCSFALPTCCRLLPKMAVTIR
jgi:predicted dienelactone hydrolase